jgi:GNAT superfamily N-acetyltransferase
METVDEYWASYFGLNAAELLSSEPQVVAHCELQGYQGAWLFRRGAKYIISAPPGLVPALRSVVRERGLGLTDDDFIAALGDNVTRVIGPAYQGHLRANDFRPAVSDARLLSAQDDKALRDLQVACDEEEWDHSDIELERHPHFGLFADGRLVAAATYRVERGVAALPGLITHPGFRGRGYGRAVLSAAVQHGLNAGLLMLYQTLVANEPAIAAAQSLGYKPYATHLAVRLQ